MKAAAARDPSAGPRGSARDSSPPLIPRASAALADVPAGKGAPPFLFEERFADRAALPKGITFAPTEVSTVGSDGGTSRGPGSLEADAEMRDGEPDAGEFAGSQRDDEPAGAGGSHTPVWPPADVTLVQLEEWLDSLRRPPADEGILARQDLLCQRIRELRMPLPAPPADPSTLVLRAKRATDKRRKQLHRFVTMRDDLLAQEAALQSAIVDAHTTIAATQRLFNLAEDEEVLRFRNYAASLDAPGRVASPGVRRMPARLLPARLATTPRLLLG